ncbi:hypothetical protein CBM2586_A50050 [Cupriavidus phytorum]|uniref:Uncharacterized protein n=1 Tax=Cupriavidus taiwanensis TaxID=164546 RepID=A0A375C277_9BURK|nr:hypothetical protein CBM2586_A50050 [Cupriavidus taiwanensis]
MSMHRQMHAMRRAWPPLRADREFGGDNKGVGTRMSAHYSTLLGEAIGYLSRYVCQAPRSARADGSPARRRHHLGGGNPGQ